MSNLILPYHLRPDTLAYFKAQPLFTAKPQGEVNVKQVALMVGGYLIGCGVKRPEVAALNFYAGNALWAELLKRFAPDEPMPQWAVNMAKWYVSTASEAAQRLIYYLLLIITREARHVYGSINPQVETKFGVGFLQFLMKLKSINDSMAAKDVFLHEAPNMRMADYAKAISFIFHEGSFGGSFGGQPWANIADVFGALIDGSFSPEMVTDVSWALAHNTGPIFNKGMTYTHFNKSKLLQILDVQRSGQIPEYLTSGNEVDSFSDELITAIYEIKVAMDNMPSAFGKEVDWDKVHKAGAVGNYQSKLKPVVILNPKPVEPSNLYHINTENAAQMYTKVRKEKVAA